MIKLYIKKDVKSFSFHLIKLFSVSDNSLLLWLGSRRHLTFLVPYSLTMVHVFLSLFPLPPFLLFHVFVCAVQDFLSSAALDGPSLNRALCASSRARLSFQVGAFNWP